MRRYAFLLITLCCATMLRAQTINPFIVSANGSSHQTSSMIIEWTMGELSITTITGPSSMITQGFHQPKYSLTSITEFDPPVGDISVYPNPTADKIHYTISFDKINSVQISLSDMNGTLLWMEGYKGQHITGSKSLAKLPNGNYIFKMLVEGNANTQTYKIQKIN